MSVSSATLCFTDFPVMDSPDVQNGTPHSWRFVYPYIGIFVTWSGRLRRSLNMETVRLLLADDHHVVRAGLRCLLETQPGWIVVAEASDGREAVEKTGETSPDVALLDIGMPVLNGLEAAYQIVRRFPRTKVVMLTVHDSEAMIHKVLAAGARGYLFKTDVARDL